MIQAREYEYYFEGTGKLEHIKLKVKKSGPIPDFKLLGYFLKRRMLDFKHGHCIFLTSELDHFFLVHHYKLWTISKKMLCKNSSNINVSYHRCLFDKYVTRMLQQEGILNVLKKIFFRQKMNWNIERPCYYYWKLEVELNFNLIV